MIGSFRLSWLSIITVVSWIDVGAVAAAAPLFALSTASPHELRPEAGTAAWVDSAGRFGGPALKIASDSPNGETRLLLLDKPRPFWGPDLYRAEAWLRANGNPVQVRLVRHSLNDGTRSVEYPVVAANGRPGDSTASGWQYGAHDLPIGDDDDSAGFNVEIVVRGGPVFINGLKIIGGESLIPHGEFREWEPDSGMPKGWRRVYAVESVDRRCRAEFELDEDGGGLVVRKSQGELSISAEPAGIPAGVRAIAARMHLNDETTSSLPAVVLRLFGDAGLLQSVTSTSSRRIAGETIVATRRAALMTEAKRIVLAIQFPDAEGTWHVRHARVITADRALLPAQLHADQAGYNAGEPLRFLLSTERFPAGGARSFTLRPRHGVPYQGRLVPLGRSVGEHGSDWGRYYFEGRVADPEPNDYHLQAVVGDEALSAEKISVRPDQRLHETAELAYRFYTVQRCGTEVPGWHAACHMDDGKLPDGSRADVTGGYHNAGDMHKHMGDNTPVSVYAMLRAYESASEFFDSIDRDANGRADLLDEVLWGGQWMHKMLDPKVGHIWSNVTNDIEYFGIPEHDTDGVVGNADDRDINTADPADMAAYTIAAWAALSRHIESPSYLQAAERLWALYESRILEGYEPRQVFAALQLYRATGRDDYLKAAEHLAGRLLDVQSADGWYARQPGGPPELKLVDEGVIPAALAQFALEAPNSQRVEQIHHSLRRYFDWSFQSADNPFGIVRGYTGGEFFFFKAREEWFGGSNSQFCSTAWAAYLAARLFADEPQFALRLRGHAADQIHWILGMNPLNLCMFEGQGTSHRIYFHHLYAEIPGHPRGAVPGAIPNGIVREPGNSDRPWFDLRGGPGSPAGAESAEPWLPHNAYYLLALSAM